jgi:hypothetical protein
MRSFAFGLALLVGCHGHGSVAVTPPVERAPLPPELLQASTRYGLAMRDDWTWKSIDRDRTRFDWEGRPKSGAFEVLYSFWIPKLDDTETKLAPSLVESAAANLTTGTPCPPFEQPPETARMLGVDRIITVCFEPAPFMRDGHLWGDPSSTNYQKGVVHGIINRGALTIMVTLSNDRTAMVPLPEAMGVRGAPR